MGYRIGVDVGGTFTDLLVVDEKGNSSLYKAASTPADPSVGMIDAIEKAAAAENLTLRDFLDRVDVIIHGTTITTNLMITGTYAKVGLLNTKGLRDVIRFRDGTKRHAYFQKEAPPRCPVSRLLSLGIEGRIDCEGGEITPLQEADVYTAVDRFRKENVESIAISFLFSFLNPNHEQKASEILEKEFPGMYICQSNEILPKARLWERTSTTVLSACVGPGLVRYLESLTGKLKTANFHGVLRIMQSNGGVMSPELAEKFAVNTLLSGPAAGPAAGLYYSGLHNLVDLITIDMGGTSFDSCLITNGEPKLTSEMKVVEYALAVPALAVNTIGAGGGTIAWIDPKGVLQVGPKSAGAEPGPACYGKGGEEATVTDADLVLGYLNPDYFLGGEAKLYKEKAEKAIRERIASKLGIDVREAALGIYRVVNANMTQGVKETLVEQGYDPRDCAIVVAGGAGPVHCVAIAREIGCPLVMVPKQSSVFCATGMLMSNLRHELVKTFSTELNETLDYNEVDAILKEMRDKGFADLKEEGIPPDRMIATYSADLRYSGQLHELEVSIAMTGGCFTKDDVKSLVNEFHKVHEVCYAYSVPGYPVDCLFLRVRVEGITEKPSFGEEPYSGEDASVALKGWREVLFEARQPVKVAIYDGNKLGNGNRITGPAIIEEPTTTIVIPPDYEVQCDAYSHYLIYPKSLSLEEILGKLRRSAK